MIGNIVNKARIKQRSLVITLLDLKNSDYLFHPVHWLQFADDATVIKSGENDNQLLLNCFTRWCQWVKMTIRVDKCTSFGIEKCSTRSLQFQLSLLINHAQFLQLSKVNLFAILAVILTLL